MHRIAEWSWLHQLCRGLGFTSRCFLYIYCFFYICKSLMLCTGPFRRDQSTQWVSCSSVKYGVPGNRSAAEIIRWGGNLEIALHLEVKITGHVWNSVECCDSQDLYIKTCIFTDSFFKWSCFLTWRIWRKQLYLPWKYVTFWCVL